MIIDILKDRSSVRNFKDEPISYEIKERTKKSMDQIVFRNIYSNA